MLVSPPGFTAFDSGDPDRPLRVYRRNLPHWRQDHATYFVTFHTLDSLPRKALEDLRELRAFHKARFEALPVTDSVSRRVLSREWQQAIAQREEEWLDQAHGACPFNDLENRQILHQILLRFEGVRVHIGAFVIMPNHVHAIVRMADGHELETWLGAVKSTCANRLNKQLGRSGPMWFEESFDRIIRDVAHLNRCVKYIGRNPIKAGLSPDASNLLWLHPGWSALGYKFTR